MVMNCPGYSKEFDPTRIFHRILVPIDYTPESRRALITACEMRSRFDSEIHLFVETDFGNTSGLRGLGIEWGSDDVVHNEEDRLRYFAESICEGMPCLANHASFGKDIVHGIRDAAKEWDATLVIMGVHDKHSLFRTRAEKVIKELDVPVMVLKNLDQLSPTEEKKAEEASAT